MASSSLRPGQRLGPYTLRQHDGILCVAILDGPDGVDPSVDGPAWAPPGVTEPRDITVYWFDSLGLTTPSADIVDRTAAAARALADRGFRVERWTPPGIEQAARMWFGAMSDAGGSSFTSNLAGGEPLHLGRQLLR